MTATKPNTFLHKKLLFNPKGDDSKENRMLIGGNTTNLFDLSHTKYLWAKEMYHRMMQNFWIPEKADISKDVLDYGNMSPEHREIYDNILSSLVFLDSLQTNNLPNISDYITAPEINLILIIQAYQEAIHSQSYAYLIDTIIPKEKLNGFFNIWKSNPVLYARNDFLVSNFQSFIDSPTIKNFFRVLVADYILESISFYMGFNIFYEFSFVKGILFGTTDIIRMINRDELSHVLIFQNLVTTFIQEHGKLLDDKEVNDMFSFGIENEKKWIDSIIPEDGFFLNIDRKLSHNYIEYLCNERMLAIGYKPIFDDRVNPLSYLEQVSGLSQVAGVKSNFFETNVTSYNMSSSVEGWDDIS